jgi:uncharacterized membrane protein
MSTPSKKLTVTLWIAQALLALVFLFAGTMKFVMPAAAMAAQSPFPLAFIYFIGVAEIAGALGLLLPGLTRIRPGLTPLAAAGLVVIMVGATITTLVIGPAAGATVPAVCGLVAAFVVEGRWHRAPIQPRRSVATRRLRVAHA